MSVRLLNENQKRRLATSLQLLQREVDALKNEHDLPANINDRIQAVDDAAIRIIEEFELVPGQQPTATHHARVLADVWAMRTSDLKAAGLSGYGMVHPDLGGRLDPLVDDLRERLRELARAAADGDPS